MYSMYIEYVNIRMYVVSVAIMYCLCSMYIRTVCLHFIYVASG